jgi:putative aldouronate transport system permease protein
MKVKMSKGDRLFYIIDYLLIIIVVAATLYPFLYIVSASVSDPYSVLRGEVLLLPKKFNVNAYRSVLSSNEIWYSYKNTLWYVIVGTAVNIFMTILMAYPLSRKKFFARKHVNLFVAITMFFSAPLIPTYLVVRNMHLIDSMWALVIPTAIDSFYLIIMRSFFEEIPESLFEAATIDGCNDIQILYKIVIYLSGPVIAVMVLFYAVFHWNSYFGALLYINDSAKYPLQMILRKILISMDVNKMTNNDTSAAISTTVQYAAIVVSTVPILCIYPFLQKYFVQGMMIGAVKG